MTIVERIARKLARLRAKWRALTEEEVALLSGRRDFDLVFVDDSRHRTPSRPGMRSFVSVGALSIPSYRARQAANDIESVCKSYEFPEGEEFKWSPGRKLWMHSAVRAERRHAFFVDVIRILAAHEAVVAVVIVDEIAARASDGATPEEDAVTMLLERVEHLCNQHDSQCLVLADRPGGGRREEDEFLADCLEVLTTGTTFVLPENIVHNVVSTSSHLSRLLQAADLVTGIVAARVAGEREFSPPLFELVLPLFYRDGTRVGGYGLKIHAALRYCNLYHWLCGDDTFWQRMVGHGLPRPGFIYSKSEWIE
jgi:hypothetical protein